LFIAAAILFILIQTWLHRKFIFKNLEVQRRIMPETVFVGDYAELEVIVANRKIYPVTMLQVCQWLPGSFKQEKQDLTETGYEHGFTITILPFQRVLRKYRFKCTKRGYFQLGTDIEMISTDLFGNKTSSKKISAPAQIYVFPEISDAALLTLPLGTLQGDYFIKRWIHDDPITFAGMREYTGLEEARRINWKSTAKTGELRINVHDFTSDRRVIVFFYLEKISGGECFDTDLFEQSVKSAASAAVTLIKNGIPAGIASNALILPNADMLMIPPGSSERHADEVLKACSGLTAYRKKDFSEIIEHIYQNAGKEVEILIIPSGYGTELAQSMCENLTGRITVMLGQDCNTDAFPDGVNVLLSDGRCKTI
jgi:uncharacterized protein (DUF58 family)